jgi:hypothetical protein
VVCGKFCRIKGVVLTNSQIQRFKDSKKKKKFLDAPQTCGGLLGAELIKGQKSSMPEKKKAGQIAVDDIYRVSSGIIQKIYGVTAAAISVWVKDGCPRTKNNVYSLPDVVRWRERRIRRDRDEEDPKTQYLRVSARLKELDLAQKEGRLVSIPVIHQVHVRMSSIIRGAGERLGNRFGADAQIMLNEAIDEWDREAEQFIETIETDIAGSDMADEELPPKDSTDNASVRV